MLPMSLTWTRMTLTRFSRTIWLAFATSCSARARSASASRSSSDGDLVAVLVPDIGLPLRGLPEQRQIAGTHQDLRQRRLRQRLALAERCVHPAAHHLRRQVGDDGQRLPVDVQLAVAAVHLLVELGVLLADGDQRLRRVVDDDRAVMLLERMQDRIVSFFAHILLSIAAFSSRWRILLR